ncbi:MAG: sulfotransferase family protein [Gammaproteobacteria bacterium]|nr:sulfotransferase family protein [Gammaproteobacteria bacterium]
MSLEIVGAGFGRTGTLSLKQALEQLGFSKCYHMLEVNEKEGHRTEWAKAHRGEAIDWDTLYEGYKATVDWPSCNLWREQAIHFPDAKILLSQRDPESWYKSIMNTIYPTSKVALESDDPALQYFGRWAFELIWDGVFNGRLDDKDHVISIFHSHNQAVIDEVPADRLLVFEAKQGWEPLCDFLEVPVPDTDYPRTNTTEQFLEIIKQRAEESS